MTLTFLLINHLRFRILIFYTGKEKLSPAIENHLSATTMLVKKRPNLYHLIPNIIYGIESGIGVPESMKPDEKSRVKGMIANKVRELEAAGFSEEEIIEELTMLAHESGFLLSNMLSEDVETLGVSLLDAIKKNFAAYEPQFESSMEKSGYDERVRRRRSRQGSFMKPFILSNQISMKGTGYCPWENQDLADEFVKGLSKFFYFYLCLRCLILLH